MRSPCCNLLEARPRFPRPLPRPLPLEELALDVAERPGPIRGALLGDRVPLGSH